MLVITQVLRCLKQLLKYDLDLKKRASMNQHEVRSVNKAQILKS
jgi:hypothetical protein